MNPSYSSSFFKDRDLLSRSFVYNQDRRVWVYLHDDQVFRVMAACAKLNIPCRNIPQDDPSTIEITNEDWERIFTLPLSPESPEPLPQEDTMKMKSSETLDNQTPLETEDHEETKIRYYRFDGPSDRELDPESEDILMAAESQMNDEEEHDMETAVHALAERTSAIIPLETPKEEDNHNRPFVLFSGTKTEQDEDSSLDHVLSSRDTKDNPMIHNENQATNNNGSKNFGELSTWEQVLEERESTLAAREKVLRLRQKDVQDMEERLYEERKAFNADYEEKKAFLEDKEQRLKKIFERVEEVAFEFRRHTSTEGATD
jgi:hypothetical protein